MSFSLEICNWVPLGSNQLPEIAEVETVRRLLEATFRGLTIDQTHVWSPALRYPIDRHALFRLKHCEVTRIKRHGKALFFETGHHGLAIHLGMSGVISCEAGVSQQQKRHDHWRLIGRKGRTYQTLTYYDPRRFGWVKWTDTDQWLTHAPKGRDALLDLPDARWLWEQARRRRCAIKSFLLDQSIIAGIGNIYADESLHRSRIHPLSATCALAQSQWTVMRQAIVDTISAAVARGGSTLGDDAFRSPDGKPGYFTQQLNAYGRAGQPCLTCQRVMTSGRVSQRTTTWCPSCQRKQTA